MTEALIELHRTHGATLAETPGGALPLRYGGLVEEVEVFRSGTGILDLEAAGTILLRGPEAEVYLDGIVSHDVKGQPMGTLRHHLLCANKGKILFDIQLLRTKPGEFLLLTEPGELQGVANHLDFYHVREDGGTKISSAFQAARTLIENHYNSLEWNIYLFHFSDGDNSSESDSRNCCQLLREHLLPNVNLFGYCQVASAYGSGNFINVLHEHMADADGMLTSRVNVREDIYDSIKTFFGSGR